jgi:hypothetical protein
MKYDDGGYHLGSARSEAHAAAHIGLYFRWCLDAGLVSEEHTEDPELSEELEAIRRGRLTGTEYLWRYTSGKLSDDDLTEEGNRFSRTYMSKSYLGDLRRVTGKADYQFTEAEVDFSRLKAILDERLREWRRSPPARPWWKLWG